MFDEKSITALAPDDSYPKVTEIAIRAILPFVSTLCVKLFNSVANYSEAT